MKTISWPGAKRRVIEQLLLWCPVFDIECMCEPFWGTGALTMQLLADGKITGDIYAAESNAPLRAWWSWVVNSPDDVISRLTFWREKYQGAKHNRDVFNDLRNKWNDMWINSPDSPDTVAMLWCLIYASTNNLARFNKKGGYNQTWGKGRVIPDPIKIFTPYMLDIFANLNGRLHMYNSFEDAITEFNTKKGNNVCYLDPPYILQSGMYSANQWQLSDLQKLMNYIDDMEANNTWWFYTDYLKNADKYHPFKAELEQKFNCESVSFTGNARPGGSSLQSIEAVISGKAVSKRKYVSMTHEPLFE